MTISDPSYQPNKKYIIAFVHAVIIAFFNCYPISLCFYWRGGGQNYTPFLFSVIVLQNYKNLGMKLQPICIQNALLTCQ